MNHKRIYVPGGGLRIRRLRRDGSPRPALDGTNQEWALAFVHDAFESGRRFRALGVGVTWVLEAMIAESGVPQAIRSDNGLEFTSRHLLAWCTERKIEVVHIEPGKPVQNAHIRSFHGKLRDEFLKASWFANLFDARRKIAAWRIEYNERTAAR